MKISREKLLEALDLAYKVVPKGSTSLPILQAVKIDGPGQAIFATDLEIAVRIPIEISDFKKTVTVSTEQVPEVPEDLLEGLKKEQLVDLAGHHGIEVKKSSTVKSLQKAIMKVETADYDAKKAEADAQTESRDLEESFCLPCDTLKKIVYSMVEEEHKTIEIVAGEDNGLLFSHPFVTIGKNFQNIATYPSEDFPVFVEYEFGEEAEVKVSVENLKMVLPAVYKEEGFSVILFDDETGLAVATDGSRLHSVKATVGKKVMIQPKIAKIMMSLFKEEISFNTNGENIKVMLADGTFIQCRGYDGRFPDYSGFLKDGAHEMVVERFAVEQSIKQAMLLTNSSYTGVTMKLNGGIDIEYRNPEMGGYQKVQIPAKKGLGKGNEVTLGMNAQYFLDAITTAKKADEVVITVTDASSPMTFKHHDFYGLVMPSRL